MEENKNNISIDEASLIASSKIITAINECFSLGLPAVLVEGIVSSCMLQVKDAKYMALKTSIQSKINNQNDK